MSSTIEEQNAIINAVRRHGGDLRSYQLRLQVRGWNRLPPSLQRQIREHRSGLILRFGIEGCRQVSETEVAQLWEWLDSGQVQALGDGIVELAPWWRMSGNTLHNHLDGVRRWWSWMDRPAARVQLGLIYDALEPIFRSPACGSMESTSPPHRRSP